MKVIILCGGKGTRLREETEFRPKPMVMIGELPILVHIMNIYARFGHKEFLLCLGYKSEMIREYFLHLSNFTNDLEVDLSNRKITYLNKQLTMDYKVSFIETGDETASGERVRIAADYIVDDRFMVTYGDGVGNVNLEALLEFHQQQTKKHDTLATITAAHPSSKYGQVIADRRQVVKSFAEKPRLEEYINGGFMVFEKRASSFLRTGESLEQALERLTKRGKLSMFKHEGFWHGMDTMKDVIDLNKAWADNQPWVL